MILVGNKYLNCIKSYIMLAKTIIILVLPFVIGIDNKTSNIGDCCGRCVGSVNCTACKNCSSCKHCNSGGSCGVCGGGRRSESYSPPTGASVSLVPSAQICSIAYLCLKIN